MVLIGNLWYSNPSHATVCSLPTKKNFFKFYYFDKKEKSDRDVDLSWANVRLGGGQGWRGVAGLECLGVLEPLSDGALSEGAEAREGAVLTVVVELNGTLLHS